MLSYCVIALSGECTVRAHAKGGIQWGDPMAPMAWQRNPAYRVLPEPALRSGMRRLGARDPASNRTRIRRVHDVFYSCANLVGCINFLRDWIFFNQTW